MQLPADPPRDWLAQLAALGYTAEPTPLPGGRPDHATVRARTRHGTEVVAKLCGPHGEQAFNNMRALWASTFGAQRKPPGMPQPLDYIPDPGILIAEYVDGRPLAEAARISEKHTRMTGELLVALHESNLQPPSRRRTSRRIVRSARRKADRIAELAPQYAEAARSLADAIESRRVGDTELVSSHGDFSPRNVLAAADRLVLIDWDRLQLADPARDVVYFGISTWLPRLRRGRLPNRDLLDQTIRSYTAARPSAKLKAQLHFHIAAGLMRIACSLVELWPADAYLVPALITIARRELDDE
jgi:aminoglycoside phosphotransferase (APT) family kinase protein